MLRLDSDRGEDAAVPRLVVVGDDDELDLAGVQHRRRPHEHLDAGIHRAAHDPFAVGQHLDLAGDLEWPARLTDRRHVGLAAELQGHRAADPGPLHLPNRRRIPDRGDRDVRQPLADNFADRRHHVLGGAGAAIVGMVEQDGGALGLVRGPGDRVADRLVAIDEVLSDGPGAVEQPVADFFGQRPVAVRHDDRRIARIRHIGEGEAAERGRRQYARPALRFATDLNQAPHRLVVGALAQGLRQHRGVAPGHPRPAIAGDRIEHDVADLLADRVHVDMGIGLVADQRGAVRHHHFGQVAMQVQGHRDRQIGRDRADPLQQHAFAVEGMGRHHGTVQVEQHRVAAGPDRLQDRFGQGLVSRFLDRPRRHRLGRDRCHDLGAGGLRQLDIGADRHAGAAIGGERVGAEMTAPRLKAREVGHDRRERVGFVLHHGDDETHVHPRLGAPKRQYSPSWWIAPPGGARKTPGG